jgi:toxin FitB
VPLLLPTVDAVRVCVEAGVVGGAVYDGLVGLAAREAGLPLLTCDARAVGTYRSLRVPFDLVQG